MIDLADYLATLAEIDAERDLAASEIRDMMVAAGLDEAQRRQLEWDVSQKLDAIRARTVARLDMVYVEHARTH